MPDSVVYLISPGIRAWIWSTTPASVLLVMAFWVMVLSDVMPAESSACTVTAPPAATVPGSAPVKSMKALARLLTLLLASTPPPATDLASSIAPGMTISSAASEIFSLPTVALICAVDSAVTLTSPAACTVVSRSQAITEAGCWPLKADEISGSPSRASTALNRMFCAFQPMELKATTAVAESQASTLLVVLASISERFSA